METIFFIVIIAGIGVYIYGKMPKVRKKPKTLADALLMNTKEAIAEQNPYVHKLSDKEFQKLFSLVAKEFDIAAEFRGERITGGQKLAILNEIIFAMGIKDKEFGIRHLYYELERYKTHGIRKKYKDL